MQDLSTNPGRTLKIYACHANVFLEDYRFAIHLHVKESLTSFVLRRLIKKYVVQIGRAQEVRQRVLLALVENKSSRAIRSS